MAAGDVYAHMQELDPGSLEAIVARLEARGRNDRFMGMLHEYLDLAGGLEGVRAVVALGCGTGVEARALARRPDFSGQITGVDISPALLARGAELARREGVGERILWQTGDARALALPDAAFDVVLVHTLVSHVPGPERVLEEAARLAAPGGRVAVFDGDYATIAYGSDDPCAGCPMDAKIIATVATNPRVMRSLPRFLRRAGLDIVAARSWVLAEVGRADYYRASIESIRHLLPAAGTATVEEVEAFAADQLRSSEEGAFFSSCTYSAVIARRPPVARP